MTASALAFASRLASPKARALDADLARVARRPYNILITGETGTGKTRAARLIHRQSVRASRPFVELNCANLPENLVEAELFGYRKGAFTGADRDQKGLFEEADTGILFLDEIGDIPLAVQNKLLKAIEEKRIKRLGVNRFTECDVQLIAATSRCLPDMVQRGEFREDLYCRLAVLTVTVPPLRERREDIPALLDYYLREAAQTVAATERRPVTFDLTPEAVALLCAYDYPGNIRVLRNLIYELTSYIQSGEAVTYDLAAQALGKLSAREQPPVSPWQDAGDIILPLEVCVLRQGETFREWTARAKQCSIEATRQALNGSMQQVATRLGLTHGSLRGHLYRAKALPRATGATL